MRFTLNQLSIPVLIDNNETLSLRSGQLAFGILHLRRLTATTLLVNDSAITNILVTALMRVSENHCIDILKSVVTKIAKCLLSGL